MTRSDGEDDEPHAGGRGNLFALIAVVVLIALGYLAFNYIDQQRKLQDCLDSGATTANSACTGRSEAGDLPAPTCPLDVCRPPAAPSKRRAIDLIPPARHKPAPQRRVKRRIRFSGSPLGSVGRSGGVGVCTFKTGRRSMFSAGDPEFGDQAP